MHECKLEVSWAVSETELVIIAGFFDSAEG